LDLNQFQQKLNLDLSRVSVNKVLEPARSRAPRLAHKYAELRAISAATRRYDVFINQETLTTIPCHAPRGVVLCQIPPRRFNPDSSWLNNVLRILMGRLLYDGKLQTYQTVLVYSRYVQTWAQRYYRAGLQVRVLPPPVATHSFVPAPKENMILGVGRFFTGTHNKKQLELIRIFKTLYQTQQLAGHWQLHLVGNVDPDPPAQQYARQCEREARDYPISLHFNASFAAAATLRASDILARRG
jgi:glycosyltransferase involved in cell wall biosynthesis